MTPLERRLGDEHRQLQIRLAALTMIQLRGLWRLLNPDDLPGTTDTWTAAVLRLVIAEHAKSAAVARDYIRRVRTATLGAAPAGTLPTPGLAADAVTTSLIVTGPVRIRRAQRRNQDIGTALDLAFTESSRASSRHILAGGRDTVTGYVKGDRRAGWQRLASGTACVFCSSLASRGAVYSESSVSFAAHDGCRCSSALTYR